MTKIIDYLRQNGMYNKRPCGKIGHGNKSTMPLKKTKCNISDDKKKRIEKIKQYHEENPMSTKNDLITFTPETKYMVSEYFKTRSVNNG